VLRFLTAASIATILSGCAGSGEQSCPPELGAASTVFTLFFGQAIPARSELTDKEWQAFLDDTITVNLPNGYTLFDANGAWMNPMTHKTIREHTKVLIVALPNGPDSLTAVNRIRTAYQLKFHQQMVGMTVQHACAAF
jgi:hypothetical protein